MFTFLSLQHPRATGLHLKACVSFTELNTLPEALSKTALLHILSMYDWHIIGKFMLEDREIN